MRVLKLEVWKLEFVQINDVIGGQLEAGSGWCLDNKRSHEPPFREIDGLSF